MNVYPAISARMGSWNYYIVKMRMKELSAEVRFASEVYEDRTLDDAIQRTLNETRVKKEIVTFLSRRPDRFFNSIVVSALGGKPKFFAVSIEDDPKFEILGGSFDEAFGVLRFDGEQKYYALDGQHRLKAIKTLLDRSETDPHLVQDGFPDEEISVIMIVADDSDPGFLKSYRRLFSSLNRYAKPTDADTNIIMDEDDAFAILTRRLISEHPFFRWDGKHKDSPRVQTRGKNLKTGEPHFTSLQTLYAVNQLLLTTPKRADLGWGTGEKREHLKQFMRFRPDEEYLDNLYDELSL